MADKNEQNDYLLDSIDQEIDQFNGYLTPNFNGLLANNGFSSFISPVESNSDGPQLSLRPETAYSENHIYNDFLENHGGKLID